MTSGSLTTAADLPGISQPAISHLIANLEPVVRFFGDRVDFDKDSWRAGRD